MIDYVYVGDFRTYVAPAEIVQAAAEGKAPPAKIDRRTRFWKALNAWGKWMDACEAAAR